MEFPKRREENIEVDRLPKNKISNIIELQELRDFKKKQPFIVDDGSFMKKANHCPFAGA